MGFVENVGFFIYYPFIINKKIVTNVIAKMKIEKDSIVEDIIQKIENLYRKNVTQNKIQYIFQQMEKLVFFYFNGEKLH